jgi:hypothetical protein
MVDGFDRVLELPGITFHASCPNDSSLPSLKIVPGKLEIDNSEVTREADGHVVPRLSGQPGTYGPRSAARVPRNTISGRP